MTFNFSLTSAHKYDPVESSHFGQSVRNPLIAAEIKPVKRIPGLSLPDSYSFCSVSQRNVIIQSVKRAESGDGFIIRLREITGRKTTASIKLPHGNFKKVVLCNLMEDAQSTVKIVDGKIEVPVKANGFATVWVK